VQPQILAVAGKGRTLQTCSLARLNPESSGFSDGDAVAVGGMNARTDLNPRSCSKTIRGFLFGEGLQVALASLVDVVNDPSFLRDSF
jgi:hypothetical protein